ncbi:hypothetical protein COT75_01200 [Candidatus Beckwithbacteria bacterium CG10_big_fil_rev_8_21_14_0_10_34_10]|uniref:Uncharacterized protein n=1 Tax=Candidatus Beckwithbacteria bacterium CG10_big_fil_rev_8_21_14_0_10_34_10 TaxID=1974495 RepID=A0A2H0WA22_9BACT|nr:MAG: hypothetical protein COT75_01200 [Candidatus Beckwithbacteria bacterium CG10_big_fil_rev_8_21_14_0_10_34_10]
MTEIGKEELPVKMEKAPEKVLGPAVEEKDGEKIKKKKKKHFLYISIVLIFLALLGGGILVSQRSPEETLEPLPSPTESPLPSSSPPLEVDPDSLEGKVNSLEKKLKEVDLKEESLSPTRLDFKLRFQFD